MPRLLRILLLLYVVFLCLPRLEFLPFLRLLGPSIHVTELLFVLLAPLALWYGRKRMLQPVIGSFLLGGLALLGILTLATLRANHPQGYFELTARYYLFGVFLVFYWAVRTFGPPFLRAVLQYWYYGAGFLAFLAYLGYPLALLGWTELVWVYPDYPYFGTVYRAVGAAGGSIALIIILLLPAFHDYWCWRTGGKRPWFLLLCLPLFVLSFSKEALLLPIGLLTLEVLQGRLRVVSYLLIGLLIGVYNLSTHYFLQFRQDIYGTLYTQADYSPGIIAWRTEHYQLLETTYTVLKRTAIYQARLHPWVGLGADQFQQALQDNRPTQVYPQRLPAYAPHSTWLGVLAEAGCLGLLALLMMVYGLSSKLRGNLVNSPVVSQSMNYTLVAFFLILGVASVNYDLLHRAFVWVPLALVLGQVDRLWRYEG